MRATLASSCAVFLTVTASLLSGCDKDKSDYRSLRGLTVSDPVKAGQIALRLSATTNGVRLAIRDLTILGGANRGLNKWILVWSPLTNMVVPELSGIVVDRNAFIGRRIEAAWILWLRTADHAYLDQVFHLVRLPGGHIVGDGRRYLMSALGDAADELRQELEVPPDQVVPVNEEDFKALIRKPGATIWISRSPTD
jgi:hypothetical protein